MDELWEFATSFIGPKLVSHKAVLMYYGNEIMGECLFADEYPVLKHAWHHNLADKQLGRFITYMSVPRQNGYSYAKTAYVANFVSFSSCYMAPLPHVYDDYALVRGYPFRFTQLINSSTTFRYALLFCQSLGEDALTQLNPTCLHFEYLKNCLAEAMVS